MNKISGGAATQLYQTIKSSALQYNCYNRQKFAMTNSKALKIIKL